MGEYLNPGDNINWEALSGFIAIGSTVIAILGLLILVGTISYAAHKAIKLALGNGGFGKGELKVIGFAVIGGLLLSGGGWLSLLKYSDRTVIEPTKKIIQDQEILKGKEKKLDE
ncbi:MAG: hypothetical protein N4A68_11810 [Maledivibacter sp.]|jgi:hypothetical protein|nr:hypothetical protein [Maledivibacter sp.]